MLGVSRRHLRAHVYSDRLTDRFGLPEAARTARLGLVVGLGYGFAQDSLSYLRGRKIGYVEYIKRMSGTSGEGSQEERATP